MNAALRIHGLVVVVLVFAVAGTGAQDALLIDELRSQDALSIGQAAFLLYRSAIQDNPPATIPQSMERLAERHRRFRDVDADEAVRLSDFTLIALNAFDVPGGIMYSVTDSPRYAYREAVYRQVVQGRTSPRDEVSGDRALRVVHRLLSAFPPSVFEDTERIRARIRELQQQIATFDLRVFDPPAYALGTEILQAADARRESLPAEAFQDYERAETAFAIVVNTGFPVVIEDARLAVIQAREEAIEERADTSLPDEFSRLQERLEAAERLRRQGLFPEAYAQYEDLTQRFLALASVTREMREEAEDAVNEAEDRLQEIRNEEQEQDS